MLEAYREHVAEREALGIPPKPLNAEQTAELVELLKNPPKGEEEFLVYLLENRIPPGVDEAAYVKAGFLSAIAKGEATSPLLNKEKAVELLGMMQGGYNIATLVELLDNDELAKLAGEKLKKTLLMFDAFNDVKEKMDAGNAVAKEVVESWANAEWFTSKKKVPESTKMVVFKVTGETNTDDLSPAPDAWSRPDIPLHARAAYKMERDGLKPEEPGVTGPMGQIDEIKSKGLPVAFVGDVVGTGSSRKSATNSVLWFFGEDVPGVPNKRAGGVCIGNKVAPIFFNTMEDAGALVFEAPVDDMNMGDVIEIRPYEGKILNEAGETISEFKFKSDVIVDEYGDERRTEIVSSRRDLTVADLIDEEDLVVTISHSGYAKTQAVEDYQAQRRGGRGKAATSMKDEDFIEKLLVANSHDTILCFSNHGKVYWLRVFEIPRGSRGSRGRPMVNILPLDEGERITTFLPVRDYPEDHYVLMATSNGVVKKTPLPNFSRPRSNGLIALNLDEGDTLIGAAITQGDAEVMLFSTAGKAVRFNEEAVRPMSRTARGVRGIRMPEGYHVVSLIIPQEGGVILTASEHGYGKRTAIEEFPTYSRGSQGVIAMQCSERNGNLVTALQLFDGDEMMLISDKGTLVRTRTDEVSILSRNTQGVRLIRLSQEDERLVGVERIAESDDEDEQAEAGEDSVMENGSDDNSGESADE